MTEISFPAGLSKIHLEFVVRERGTKRGRGDACRTNGAINGTFNPFGAEHRCDVRCLNSTHSFNIRTRICVMNVNLLFTGISLFFFIYN